MSEAEDPRWSVWLAELDDETLARAIGGELTASPDSEMWHDERFVRWLRERAHGNETRHDDSEALERDGRAMLARLRARGRLP